VIDFRYHLVSIIAVFLALAIGLVVGANVLQPVPETLLNKAAQTVTRQNQNLTQQNRSLQRQVSADQNFAQAASGRLLGHLMTGQSVVLVTAPDADSKVISGVTAAVKRADGKVTGQVSVEPQFFDGSGSTETKLSQLAQSLAPAAGVTLPAQVSGDDIAGQEQAARVIAAAIVTKDGPALGTAQVAQVLGGFGQSSYLQVSNLADPNATTLAPATMAIVVPPSAPPSSTDPNPVNRVLLTVAEQLAEASHGTVLAGSLSGSGAGSAIDEVPGGGKFSTVDNANTPVGQISAVQALWERLNGRSPASYGVGPGAVPSPAPTPSVRPTSTVVQHAEKK
jgi:hypothetical protein